MAIRAPRNFLSVRVDKMYEDTVRHGSLELKIDPMFKPTHRARIFGEVVGLPLGMSKEYGKPEIKLGDKIYFHYLAMDEEMRHLDEKDVFFVPYWMVFCAVRETITPVGGWAFAEPYWGEHFEMMVEGKSIKVREGKSGLVSVIDTYHPQIARLAYIGTPRPGEEEVDVKPGELFYYAKSANFENEIEGKNYFIMQQECIIGKPIEI